MLAKHDVDNCDFYQVIASSERKEFLKPGDLHFTNIGYKLLAETILAKLKSSLELTKKEP